MSMRYVTYSQMAQKNKYTHIHTHTRVYILLKRAKSKKANDKANRAKY